MEEKIDSKPEKHQDSTYLLPGDVPGSAVDLSRLSTYRVDELKFWLSCRGDSLKNLATKAACIQRINDYVKNGQDKIVDPTPNKLYIRGKNLKQEKIQDKDLASFICSTNMCMKGDYWKTANKLAWGKDLSGMPAFTIRELELFFDSSGKTDKTKKRAENILFDNYLDNVFSCVENHFFYLKAICSASYRKNTFHKLSCCLNCTTAKVEYAYCSCVAGNGGFCNHVYALLKLVAQFALDKKKVIPELLPCTSRPCGWTVPKVRKMNVAKPTIMETVIKKAKTEKETAGIRCTLYEARSPASRLYPFDAIDNMKENLKVINPLIPLVNGLRRDVSIDEWTNTKFGKVPIYSTLANQCSLYGNNFKAYINIEILSPNHSSTVTVYPEFPIRNIPVYYPYPSNLNVAESTMLEQLELSKEEARTIEEATRDQSNNVLWHSLRKCRLTASRVNEVFLWKRGMENHAAKFVKPPSPTNSNLILQRKLTHGKMYEPVAWEKYKSVMEANNHHVEVFPSGLVINPVNCWLGCSPDAKLLHGDLFGIGESKCPEQYKQCDVFDVAKSSGSAFILQVASDNKLEARKEHSTYTQIQCQLALTGAHFCDLVVYTFKSIAIVRVQFDFQFWNKIVSDVGHKYFNFILPALSN